MAESHLLGQKGEELATGFLKNSGYKIVYRNWKWGKHEIDIIAEKDGMVIFVEVKTRSEDYLDEQINLVPPAKQKSIIFAADGYIRKNNIDKESRFDVLFIINKGNSFEYRHIEDAFYPTLR
jgi:putative endonuclease